MHEVASVCLRVCVSVCMCICVCVRAHLCVACVRTCVAGGRGAGGVVHVWKIPWNRVAWVVFTNDEWVVQNSHCAYKSLVRCKHHVVGRE